MRKFLILAALAAGSLMLTQAAKADHCYGPSYAPSGYSHYGYGPRVHSPRLYGGYYGGVPYGRGLQQYNNFYDNDYYQGGGYGYPGAGYGYPRGGVILSTPRLGLHYRW